MYVNRISQQNRWRSPSQLQLMWHSAEEAPNTVIVDRGFPSVDSLELQQTESHKPPLAGRARDTPQQFSK
jgi:hypothetical protein